MKILILHQNFVDHLHPGGTRHFELARHLLSQGHEVTIVAGNIDYLTGQRIIQTRWGWASQDLEGVRVLRAYTYPSLHRSFNWRVFAFVSFMVSSVWAGIRAGRTDVVVGTSPPIFQLPSAWLVACCKRAPFVLEVRDLWPEFAVDMGVLKNPILIWVARRIEQFFYRRAKHIVVNSPAYKDYLIAHRVAADKISVVANGVDPTMFDPAEQGDAIRSQFDLNGQFVVTYAGALGQANDIPTILRAAERLKDVPKLHFLLVGDGKDRERLQQQAAAMQLGNVTFAGTFPKNRMKDVLAASDACVATLQDIPMFRTTYPNKVFDYMAAARPTLLCIDGVIRRVIEQADGGLYVPPGNDEALAQAVQQLMQNRQQARSMGTAARAFVEQNFNRQRQAELFVDVLTGAVA